MVYCDTILSEYPNSIVSLSPLQSSTFRFSCLPVSRVECMLRLPSLDLVFSSKRADGEINEEFGEGGGGAGGGSPCRAPPDGATAAADATSSSR